MKLAQALLIRKELVNEVYELNNRIHDNLLGQEGEEPSEDPNELLVKLEQKREQLQKLIARINRTNATAKFDENMTMTDALAKMEYLREFNNNLSSFASQSSVRSGRYSKSEIKTIKYVDVVKLQKKKDDVAKQFRQLDMKIQEKNWEIELV